MTFSHLVPTFALSTLVLCAAATAPTAAAEHAYPLAPADVIRAIDDFNASVLSNAASLGIPVKASRGAVRVAGSVCPSLGGPTARVLTRVRVLNRPDHPGLLPGKRPGLALPATLTAMGATSWTPPSEVALRQPGWNTHEPTSDDLVELATTGFALGDQTGALTIADRARTDATFVLGLDPSTPPGLGDSALVLGVTTELPPTRPGRRSKRTECVLLAHVIPADVTVLEDLLAATPLTSTARNVLTIWLDAARRRIASGQSARAARSIKAFAHEVANRLVANEIALADAEALLQRSLATAEALDF